MLETLSTLSKTLQFNTDLVSYRMKSIKTLAMKKSDISFRLIVHYSIVYVLLHD